MDELDKALKGYREAIRECIDPDCRIVGEPEIAVAAAELLIGDATIGSIIPLADVHEQTVSPDSPRVLKTATASEALPNPRSPNDRNGGGVHAPPVPKKPITKAPPPSKNKHREPKKRDLVQEVPVQPSKPKPSPAERTRVEVDDHRSSFFHIPVRNVIAAVVVWILLILAIKYKTEVVALVVNALMYWLG